VSQIYVYYKVTAANRAAALAGAKALIARAAADVGVDGALSCRAEDPLTIMEAYDAVPDAQAFMAWLDAAVSSGGLRSLIEGDRHTEHFVPCA